MRIAASGLVVVSAAAFVLGCGDKKKDGGGLPPAADWQPPPGSDAALAPVVETPDEQLARCAARVFVDDAARDGNLPGDTVDDLAVAPPERAIVALRALAAAAARLPRADQHAMLLAQATLMLVERGVTDTAPAALNRVATLIDRPADSDFRPDIAAAHAARAWGRLGAADAVAQLGDDPRTGPYLARGFAEGGHGALADETLGRVVAPARPRPSSPIDPIAAAEIPVTELIRGRVAQARKLVAASSGDWRAVNALILATAAVARAHPDARAILADAEAIIDREGQSPRMQLELAELAHRLGDRDAAAAHRAKARALARDERDAMRSNATFYGLHVQAVAAGAADEAASLLAEMETRGAPPWAVTLARAEGLARTGELQRAIEEVERLPAEQSPPRGVVYLQVLARYLARPQRDAELERWLTEHICAGIE